MKVTFDLNPAEFSELIGDKKAFITKATGDTYCVSSGDNSGLDKNADTKAAIKAGLENLREFSEDAPAVILNQVTLCGNVVTFQREKGQLVIEVDREPNQYVIYLRSEARFFYQILPLSTGDHVTINANVTPTESGDTCRLYVYRLCDIRKHIHEEDFHHD